MAGDRLRVGRPLTLQIADDRGAAGLAAALVVAAAAASLAGAGVGWGFALAALAVALRAWLALRPSRVLVADLDVVRAAVRVDAVATRWSGWAVVLRRPDGESVALHDHLPRELAEYVALDLAEEAGVECGVPRQVLGPRVRKDPRDAPVIGFPRPSRRLVFALLAPLLAVVGLAPLALVVAALTWGGARVPRVDARRGLNVATWSPAGGWVEGPAERPRLVLDGAGAPVVVIRRADLTPFVFASWNSADVDAVASGLALVASRPQDDATPRGAAVRRAREPRLRFVLPRREWLWLVPSAAVLLVQPVLGITLGVVIGHPLAVGLLSAGIAVAAAALARGAMGLVPPTTVALEAARADHPAELRVDGVPVALPRLAGIVVDAQVWRAAVHAVDDHGDTTPIASDLRREDAESMAIELAEVLGVEVRGLVQADGLPVRRGAMELQEDFDARRLAVWSGLRPRDLGWAAAALVVPAALALWFVPALASWLAALLALPSSRRYELRFSPRGVDGHWRGLVGGSHPVRITAGALLPARIVHDALLQPALVLRSADGEQLVLRYRPRAELNRVASWVEEVRACAAREAAEAAPAALQALRARQSAAASRESR